MISSAEAQVLRHTKPVITKAQLTAIIKGIKALPSKNAHRADSSLWVRLNDRELLGLIDSDLRTANIGSRLSVSAYLDGNKLIRDVIHKIGMVYGSEGNLNDHYYLEIFQDSQGDYKLYAKYQSIVGSRFLAYVDKEQMQELAYRHLEAYKALIEDSMFTVRNGVGYKDFLAKINSALGNSGRTATSATGTEQESSTSKPKF